MAFFKRTKSLLKFKLQEKRLNGEDTDITLICNDQTKLKAHKLVLTCATSYFEKMFSGSFKEEKRGVAEMDFDSKTMAVVLDFAYLENDAKIIIDNLDEAEALFRAADMFLMFPLFSLCCVAAEKVMKAEDFPRVVSWRKLYGNAPTEGLLSNFLLKFSGPIFYSRFLLEYDAHLFVMIINEQKRMLQSHSADNYQSILSKIIEWVKFKQDERSPYTSSLFSKINFNSLNWYFVLNKLLTEEIINTNCDVLLQILRSSSTMKFKQ